MGWHYILEFKCIVLPEYVDFIKTEHINRYYSCDSCVNKYDCWHDPPPIEGISDDYQELLDIWYRTGIGHHFYEYSIDESNVFKCKISKKVNKHIGDLWNDYMTFLKDIIVPISSKIIDCTIQEDDWNNKFEIYTDSELRGIPFDVNNMIKSFKHIYKDGKIIGTNIIYKRSIDESYRIDLDRFYQK